jgi:hypothetical protein
LQDEISVCGFVAESLNLNFRVPGLDIVEIVVGSDQP